MSLGDDSDFANEIVIDINNDEGYDDCPACGGTGQELEGDVVVGDCPHCEGTGILDT